MGLLATCHHPSRLLPTLRTLTPTAELVQRLVADRLADSRSLSQPDRGEWVKELTDERMIQHWLTEERGSVREVFMRLYDYYEDQQSPKQ